MIKKIMIVIMTAISLNFFSYVTTRGFNYYEIITINETSPSLTKEQIKVIKAKKDELRDKYLKDWKNKSEEEKIIAIKNYRNEMDEFFQNEFGMSYENFKEKYKKYFHKR